MRRASETGDFSAAVRIGHNLGGTGAAYGFRKISMAGWAIESAALSGCTEDLLIAVEELQTQIEAPHGRVAQYPQVAGKPFDVLIADDDENFRVLARALLEDAGIQVEEARDGREAVHKMQRCPQAVLLIDIVMPEFDGLEAIRLMHNSYPQAPIVAISGATRREWYLDIAVRFGATVALEKTEVGEMLVNTVRTLNGKGGTDFGRES